MSGDRWQGIPDLLTRLEDLELPLLYWGVVDGYLSSLEIETAIEDQIVIDLAALGSQTPSAQEYLDHLLDRGLVHQIPTETELRYRTRIGEGLRLVRRLRQLWPPKESSVTGWWRSGAPLVADYRLRVAPRRYPRRDINEQTAIEELQTLGSWSDVHGIALKSILRGRSIARFQFEATESLMGAIEADRPMGRIITAGTGSGKTLAFYLPALMDIVSSSTFQRSGPHTLALYPRNELLRDQAREALITCRELRNDLSGRFRTIKIGVLYGSTPETGRALDFSNSRLGWKKLATGWAAPYFPCITEGCRGDLLWSDSDRKSGVERLACSTCGATTGPDELVLTREELVKNPPDILFSTTEMLSKQSTNPKLAQLLGWNGPNGTRLVLLDEVHTYSGVHGAQVGLMLRRWRHANGQSGTASPVVAGLSATLRDAGDFFSELTGVERADVEVLSPKPEDMAATSREYGLVLRGDPISGASLLSTTIQTAMLTARLMDRSPGIFGSSVFAFTDDLDVTNRLYDDLRDAEGLRSWGGRPGAGPVLANLRDPADQQSSDRYRDGQSWSLPDQLGRLGAPLSIGRTSSQDSGVDANADVVVATASLEVGFNDPRVGLVIQHKAPRDMASFLQRRGRAGRNLQMRPITAVVLSDYGRDRIAYQTYEKLLDPEIDARNLPVGNRFVIKMQAAHALLDWLSRVEGIDARSILTPPRGNSAPPAPSKAIQRLRNLLARFDVQRDLQKHLQKALRLSWDEASAAMWEEPRSLMHSVVPTSLRRLESDWAAVPGDTDPGRLVNAPLPEFLTRTLFDSLNSPDVEFELPPALMQGESQVMGIAAALREAVPGRVSRRYGVAHASHRAWLPVPAVGDDVPLLDVVTAGHGLGTWTTAEGENFFVVRPLKLRLEQPPKDVTDYSNARPVWRSSFEFPPENPTEMGIPRPSVWAELVQSCSFALHVTGDPLTVRRMSIGSEADIAVKDASGTTRTSRSLRYIHEGEPAALGFELQVDAMVLTGRMASLFPSALQNFSASPEWRTLAFRRRLAEDTRLDGLANGFQREWLTEIYLQSFVARGVAGGNAGSVVEALKGGLWASDLTTFFAVAYRTDTADVEGLDRTTDTLRDLTANDVVRCVVEEHSRLLAHPAPAIETADLLTRSLMDTLAAAVLAAVHERLDDAQDSDLVADVLVDEDKGEFRILISETAIGGLGLLEKLQRDYASDPRRFWDAVGGARSASDYEEVDASMRSLLNLLTEPQSGLSQLVARYRRSTSVKEMDESLNQILETWKERDGKPSHLSVSTFASRFLRPGGRPESDRAAAFLIQRWPELEKELGVEIDPRTVAFHAAEGNLGKSIAPLNADSAYAMLWLRGPKARNQHLDFWQPYRTNIITERLVLEAVSEDGARILDVTGEWIQQYVESLTSEGRVRLTAPFSQRELLATAIRQVSAIPLEQGALRVYGRLISLRQRGGTVSADISIAEELQ